MGETTPKWKTGWLWGVLAILLTLGTVAAAFFVYGLTDLLSSGRWYFDVPIVVVGGFMATVLLLLISGILYRVDRIRGVPHREVRLFE